MKKLIIIALIVGMASLLKYNSEEYIVIPNEAIRLRVIASSNSEGDQLLKREVKRNLTKELFPLIKEARDINEAREKIRNNFKDLSLNIKEVTKDDNYQINYGKNYFPEKTYKGVKYPAGQYESLVVKLGDGAGKNFWCVLFPPLCLLEGEKDKANDVEYKFLVKDILKKYFQ
ncbi:MAG: stage II sporulation protein R [Bacilli bacterium]|nr:stage II sporulation protein R [Bacilli bacterium]